jgi:hypothetical protein
VFAFGGLFCDWAGLYELFCCPPLEPLPLVLGCELGCEDGCEDGWPAAPLDAPLGDALRELLEFGGVNGRNPSLDFGAGVEPPPGRAALAPPSDAGRFAGVDGVDGPRASCGDMAGA